MTFDFSGLTVSGTLTLDTGGTYAADSTIGGSAQFSAPQSCLPQGATCADLSDQDVTCSASGSQCLCSLSFPSESNTENGTWSVTGSSLTLTPEGQDASASDFCVEGDVLKFHDEDPEQVDDAERLGVGDLPQGIKQECGDGDYG